MIREYIIKFLTKGAEKAEKDFEKVEKAQKKVSKESKNNEVRLNAVADALDQMGLTGAASLFSVGEGIGELAGGFKGLKGAIAAAGIGLLITLAAEAASAIAELVEFTSEEARALRELQRQLVATGDDIIQQEARIQRHKLANREQTEESLKREHELQEELLALKLKEAELALDQAETADERNAAGSQMLTILEEQYTFQFEKENQLADFRKSEADKAEADIKTQREEWRKLYNLRADKMKYIAELEAMFEQQRKDALQEASFDTIRQREEEAAAREQAHQETINKTMEALEQFEEIVEEMEFEENLGLPPITVLSPEEEASKAAAIESIYGSTMQALGSARDLFFEEGSAGSKSLALAEIAAGTATGFIQALDIAQKGAAGTGPAAAFAFPIFYASQIASVLGAAAQAKNVLQGGGGGGGAPGGGVSAPRPNFAVASTTPDTDLQTVNPAPVQAYVVGQNITNQQSLDNELMVQSRL